MREGFLRYRFGGLIFGGAYFRNFTVQRELWKVMKNIWGVWVVGE